MNQWRLVVLESPYAGGTRINLKYASLAVRDCILNYREAPFASHLQYGLATENGHRETGILCGFIWGQRAEASVVYTDLGITQGMKDGIAEADRVRRPVIYRTLPGDLMAEFVKFQHEFGICIDCGHKIIEIGHPVTCPRHE